VVAKTKKMINTAQRWRGESRILNGAHAQERTTMSDRSSQRKPTPDANINELQAEGEAIDSAISSGLFLAPRHELLKKEAELKHFRPRTT
jgi:hypothetical protein